MWIFHPRGRRAAPGAQQRPRVPGAGRQAKRARMASHSQHFFYAQPAAARKAARQSREWRDRSLRPRRYGHLTKAGRRAIVETARLEGLLLDPVYTGKAMAGLSDLIGNGKLTAARDVIFLHTGGAPALFAYGDQIPVTDDAG